MPVPPLEGCRAWYLISHAAKQDEVLPPRWVPYDFIVTRVPIKHNVVKELRHIPLVHNVWQDGGRVFGRQEADHNTGASSRF